MNVRNCRRCGKIFNYISGPLTCPACKEALEEKFQEVKAYIREHKGASIPEVSQACDVEASQITQWLRDDRLEVTEGSALQLQCEACGTTIRSGRYCDKCKGAMQSGLNQLARGFSSQQAATTQQAPKSQNQGMFMRR